MCESKSQVSKASIHTCRSFLCGALQGMFVVIPQISQNDICYIIKKEGLLLWNIKELSSKEKTG